MAAADPPETATLTFPALIAKDAATAVDRMAALDSDTTERLPPLVIPRLSVLSKPASVSFWMKFSATAIPIETPTPVFPKAAATVAAPANASIFALSTAEI